MSLGGKACWTGNEQNPPFLPIHLEKWGNSLPKCAYAKDDTVEWGWGVSRERVAIWVGARTRAPAFPANRPTLGDSAAQPVPGIDRRSRKNGMDITWLTDRIAVGGGIWTAENMEQVAGLGITHVIDMQIEFDDTPLGRPLGIEVLWNPTDDDFQPKPRELFGRGLKFAENALEREEAKIFIHCAAGVHRAPMMALALLGSMGWSLEDAIQLIERRRPVADLAEVYVESVKRFLDGNHDTR